MNPFLPGRARLDEVAARARGGQEHGQGPRDELAAVVRPQIRRRAPPLDEALQHALDARRLGVGPDLQRQTLAYIEENVSASFDLAQRLVQARTPEEIIALQQEYIRRQMMALTEQGQALAAMVSRTTTEAAKPGKKR